MTTTAARAGTRHAPRKRAGNGKAPRDGADDVGLDALVGHAGYAVRRFQIWIFQDFIKTLGEVDIRPTQYSVLTVIGANPGLSQMAVAKRLGIERARLVHLLDALEQRKLVKRIDQVERGPALACAAPHRARRDGAREVQAARGRARAARRGEDRQGEPGAAAPNPLRLHLISTAYDLGR